MSKRANGEGTIDERKDGRWCALMSAGNGKRKQFLGRSRAEVARKLTTAIKDRDDGLPVIIERQSVEKFLTSWLKVIRPTIRERTWIRYEQYVRLHAIPALGKSPLEKLTPQHLQRLYAARLEAGASPTTVHHLHATLHKALEQAVRWNLVPRNVADQVDPPRISRFEMRTLSPDEARRLLRGASGDRLEALLYSRLPQDCAKASCSGCDGATVNLDSGSLEIRGSLQRLSTGLTVTEPKTGTFPPERAADRYR